VRVPTGYERVVWKFRHTYSENCKQISFSKVFFTSVIPFIGLAQLLEVMGKPSIMNNLLYIIAVVLIIFWLLGFYVYSVGYLIHILLVIAVIAILVRLIRGDKVV
jgi:hypothetical protein